MFQYLVFLGAAAQLVGIIHYVKETLKGKTKPNRVTWLMWAIAPLIATFAAVADGVRLAALPVFMAGFGPLLVFLASFINSQSYWKLEKFDYLCGFFSLLALVLWGITKEPTIAIPFAIISDGFAAIPTLTKSWKYPETETVSPYVAALFGAFTGFAAIKLWNFSAYAFPAYLVLVNIALIFAISKKKFISLFLTKKANKY